MSDWRNDVRQRNDPDAWGAAQCGPAGGRRRRPTGLLQERHGPSQRYLDLVEEKRRLQAELAELHRREALLELEADRERRAMAAEVRRLHRQVERAAEHRQRPPGRRARRSAHVLVDSDAWAVLKRAALEANRTVARLVTDLIVDDLGNPAGSGPNTSPHSRRRRRPGEGLPQPAPRVIRLHCDDHTWHRVRLVSDDVGLPLARYLGEIMEAAAFTRGWRAKP